MIEFALSLLCIAALATSFPTAEKRTVQALNQAAFAQAQQRDDTATRAFSSVEIKTSSGQCLFVDELSGDFRANLTPIQVSACNGSAGQLWDVITNGKHDDQAGTMLVVSTLTQACLNFDPRRALPVVLFSCGGRADGSGTVSNSQLFNFTGTAGPLALEPENANGTCLAVNDNVLDQAACDSSNTGQFFTFGNGSAAISTPSNSTAPASPSSAVVITSSAGSSAPTITTAPTSQTNNTSGTVAVPVSRAGVVLNPSAAAEANPRDDTATRAFSSVPIKSASGQCLFINPTAGDFRENLIPIQFAECSNSTNEMFDIITAGKHNDQANSILIVSSLTQGCLNFDPRRAANDTVIMFSCGGRADGGGLVTDSQLFNFTAGESLLALAPKNGNGVTCLAPNGSFLGSTACNNSTSQIFTIG